ncbi:MULTISPECIES: hypothetical protein [unclassified Brevundimonas]|uniref:hypothetical protein n=1 Tax=unclassified Brevundimonas TaxID=2622653 RepID=UPI003B5885B4
MSLAAMLALLSLSGAQAAPDSPLPYEGVVRCAGLTQAASELEGGESNDGRALYDAALYWSLTATQAAAAMGRNAALAETEQTRARIRAVRELSADNADARAELQRCRARAPRLG